MQKTDSRVVRSLQKIGYLQSTFVWFFGSVAVGGTSTHRGGVGAVLLLCLLLGTSALFAGTRPAAGGIGPFGVVGPKSITVDGNPSDWTGTEPTTYNTATVNGGEFIWNDTIGDDLGNGNYTYPKAGDLNRTGLFDLTQVRITADAENLYVLIKVANLSNAWSGTDGFSTVAAALLIDTTLDGQGQTKASPNVNIAAGAGWEYWAKIGQTTWADNAKVYDTHGNWAPIVNKANSAYNSIEASIPLAFIGKDGTPVNDATWRFMLLLGSFDGGSPTGFRAVHGPAWGEDWAFGGAGANASFAPQITDIAFTSSKAEQEKELGNYTASSYATLFSFADVTFGSLGFVPDTTPPTLSGITVTPTFNSAKIDWTTDENASTMVVWGTAPNTLNNPAVSKNEYVTAHSVTLPNLSPLTTYYYRVMSMDISGNWVVSNQASFTTTAPPPGNVASWSDNTFTWLDKTGDDVGDGDYTYPTSSQVDWYGRADLKWVNISRTATALHIHVENNANPEIQWKQRIGAVAIFIDTDHVYGHGARWVGLVGTGGELTDPHPMNLSVAPDFAWDYMVVADFQNTSAVGGSGIGEMLVFNSTYVPAQRRYALIYQSTAPSLSPQPDTGQIYAQNGNKLDIWLNYSVLGNSDNWTYAIAGMLFDDATRPYEQGGIRQVRPVAGDWVGGGSNGPFNPNVYDLAFYPDTASQVADLSQYTPTSYANVTRAVQLNLTAKWYGMIAVQNLLAMTGAISDSAVATGGTAGVVGFVTNRAVPLKGASVTLTASPAGAVDIISPNPVTTNAAGGATFTVRGKVVSTDTPVTLTMTATSGGSSVSSVVMLTVKALTHNYRVVLSAADALSTGVSSTVTATFTDKGAPVSGASVTLASSHAALVVVTSPATTNAQGVATFSVRARYTETDALATLTATATNGTSTSTTTSTLTVKGFVHAYSIVGSTSKSIVSANDTVTVTFTVKDAGVARVNVTVAISLSAATAFEIQGDASKKTDASGAATFTLKGKAVTDDTPAVITASATNGTATNVATAAVTVVAQGVPAGGQPVAAAGVAVEVFAAVVIALAAIAAILGYLWFRARGAKPPEMPPEEEAGQR